MSRVFYSRARAEKLPPGRRKEGQIIVTEYGDQELRNIMEEQGWDPAEFQRQADEATRAQAPTFREGDLPQGPTPAVIMEEAGTQGITIPREKIGAFLFCVARGIVSKSLPEAVRDCATDLPSE
jgi:hypothetical protein